MFVFPANDQAYRKRKKAFKACTQCKRGRRRCLASENDARCKVCVENGLNCSLAPQTSNSSFPSTNNSNNSNNNIKVSDFQKPAPQDESTSTRFISRLDPSSELIMVGNPDRDRVGIWVSKQGNKVEEAIINNKQPRKRVVIPSPLDQHLLSHLNVLRAFEFPEKSPRDSLIKVYFEFFHPLLPIVDKDSFLKAYEKGEHSAPLLHAVLMVAARHGPARKITHQMDNDPRNFAVECNRKIKALLYAGIETSSLNLARIYALLSTHCEGPDGFNDGAYNLSCAFHYAHSVGIHLRRNDGKQHDALCNLWWSLWCLDKLSTCMNGGPLNSHPRDVAIIDQECPPSEIHCQRLIQVCKALDEAIELYRPDGNPQIPERVNAATVMPDDGEGCTAFLRMVQYMTVILCYKRNMAEVQTEDVRTDVSSMLIDCCLQIYTIVEQYYYLIPLPIIPYAVSLTFTVFLKFFARPSARSAWKEGLRILDKQSDIWYAAEALSSMGKTILDKLEQECPPPVEPTVPAEAPLAADSSSGGNDMNGGLQSSHNNATNDASVPVGGQPLSMIDQQLSDLLFESSGAAATFSGQTSLFGELDRDVVDYWFPMGLVDDTVEEGSATPTPPESF